MGGGGLYSTVGDYLRFCRAILNRGTLDGNRVLEAATVEMMAANSMGDLDVVPLKTAIPPLSNDAEFFPGMRKKWGLTFMINTEDTARGRSAGRLAWAGLANCFYWIDPMKDVAGVIAAQIVPFADPQVLATFADFERAVYSAR
jgi:CubicO group peptidase (beta-lactamase class C family)